MTAVHAEAVIGREEELRAIGELLERASERPAALILLGEAGIGKTILWKQGVKAALERGATVLCCRPGAAETQLSFSGLDDLLSEVAHKTLPQLAPPQRRALELALLLDDGGEPPDRRAIAVACLGVIRRIASTGPVVVAVDDLQWLDRPSRFVLEFAVRRLGEAPVGFLLAQREGEEGTVPLELDRVLPEERLQRISLEPLSLGALHKLLKTRLDASFPRPTLRRVQEISGGNPFFALELARALQRQGGALAPGDDLPVPGNLHELVRDRLARLPEAAREAVLAVAALSQPTEELVEAALGPVAEQGLTGAADAGVIEFERRGRIRFTHPLLASAVSSQASRRERVALHRRLAEVVDDGEERARHLALAASKADAGVASALDAAARTARDRGAPEAAAELVEHALELTPARAAGDVYRRRLDAADHHLAAGDPDRASALLEQAISPAEPGPERARAVHALARVRLLTTGAAAARDLATNAVLDSRPDDRLRAAIEVDLAWWTDMTDGLDAALPHARAALELAESLGDTPFLVTALMTVLTFELTLGHGLQRKLLDRALELEKSLGDRASEIPLLLRPRANRWEHWLLEGDLDAARSNLEAWLELVEQLDPKYRPSGLTWLGGIELRAGNWGRAASLADEADELADQFGLELLEHRCLRAHVRALRGDVEPARLEAQQVLTRAAELGKRKGATAARGVLGFLELSLGSAAEAHALLEPALAAQHAAGVREPAQRTFLPDDVEALVLLGRLDEAQALLEPFEERARRLDRQWPLATSARCRGLIAEAQNDLPRAMESFEHAAAVHQRLPMPFERARTLLALGAARRRAKQRRSARESLQAALTIFQELGASLWIDRAQAELSRIAGRAPSAGALTPTERRVAALVATGRTNREVAAALHISERTVEGNLSRVYGKLGVRSRTELASRYAVEETPQASS